MIRPLPPALDAAYGWTSTAGELDELSALTGAELDAYVTESVDNAVKHGVTDVHADDLRELAAWLADVSAYRESRHAELVAIGAYSHD